MAKDPEEERAIPEDVDSVAVMYPSRYLKKEDLRDKDVTLTISRLTFRNVRMSNNSRERKVCIHFAEMDKRPEESRKVWICGKVNASTIAEVHGDNPQEWIGKRVTIYHDPNVMFGRERKGGIRVRPRKPE